MASTKEEIAGIFPQIVERYDKIVSTDPSKAEDALILFDLSGENGGQYWVQMSPTQAQTGEGAAENPRMTISSSAEDFGSMISGKMNPMQAFMTGKVKIKGDTSLALKLMPLING